MEILNVNGQLTMTSLAIVEYINKERGDGVAKLAHSDFLKKVPQVLGEINAGKYSFVYLGGNGQERPCYNFPKREACLMVMSYSYDVQAKIFDRWQELEKMQASEVFKVPQTLSEALLLGAELAKKVEEQAQQLAIAAPKVAVYEMLADRKQDVSTTIIAKQLGTTAQRLNQFLRDKGVKWLNADLPKAGYMDWFNTVSDVKNGFEFTQCLVTPFGQLKIAELWGGK